MRHQSSFEVKRDMRRAGFNQLESRHPRHRQIDMKRAIILFLIFAAPAYADERPLKCSYHGDITCHVVTDRIFVNSATLNMGKCQDPIETANKFNKIRDDFIVKHPDKSQFAQAFIKDYRGEHVLGDRLEIKVDDQCKLSDLSITIDHKPYTWQFSDKLK